MDCERDQQTGNASGHMRDQRGNAGGHIQDQRGNAGRKINDGQRDQPTGNAGGHMFWDYLGVFESRGSQLSESRGNSGLIA